MRGVLTCVLALAAGFGAARAADDAALKKAVKAKVEELNGAVHKGDYEKVADFSHPTVVKGMGGREKMVATMRAGTKEVADRGFAFRSFKVDDPSDPVAAGAELDVLVPFGLEMKAPGGRLLQRSYVVGVSGDGGKSWAFVNGIEDAKKLKQVLPNLPDRLKLPEHPKPVFEKD